MPYPYQDEKQQAALPQAREVTIPPASPHQKYPVTIGTYGPPEGAHQSLPVFRPVPGYKGGYPPEAVPQAPRISGAAPVQAVQAATPPVGAPLVGAQEDIPRPLSRTSDGVFPYAFGPGGTQQGFAFRDPLTGQERGFGTEPQAQAALGASTAGTPEALTGARNDILQRAEQGLLSTGGIPEGAFNEKEQALVPGIEQQAALLRQVSLAAPAIEEPGTGASPAGRPEDGTPSTEPASGEGVEGAAEGVGPSYQHSGAGPIPGIPVSRGGTGGTRSADQLFSDYNKSLRGEPIPMFNALENHYIRSLIRPSAPKKLPTLSQVQGQRFMDLAQNPGGITEADKLVFGKGGQGAGLKVYEHPIYDQYGAQSGTTPFLYDPKTGKAQELQLPGTSGTQGGKTGSASGTQGQGAAPPSLGAFLAAARNDPRNAGVSEAELVKHYNQSYGGQ